MDARGGPSLLPPLSLADCEAPIPRRFEALARLSPERVAVRDRGRSTSYGQLEARANGIAQAVLRERGGDEEAVALLLGKDAGLIAAFLGALKAGKIYVPLDPAHPAERSRLVLEDSGATILLTDAAHAGQAGGLAGPGHRILEVDGIGAGAPPVLTLTGDRLATILYTSGSTGRPKGVLQNHRNTLRNARNAALSMGVTADDRVLLVQSGSVVGGVRDTLTALLNGATLVLYDLAARGVGQMAETIRGEGITILNMVVTVFRHFAAGLAAGDRFASVRVLKSGSESLAPADVEAFRRHFPERAVLWSGFGTTETGNVTQLLIDRDTVLPAAGVPTGHCLEGMEVLVLDEAGRPVPAGEVGEVVIRSDFLALGYWRQPELTREVFLPDMDGRGRRYRTGDLGRLGASGLELLGRQDSMVKVRGQKVELGEVERALLAHPGVKQAVVLAGERAPGDMRLAAYVAPRALPGPTPDELRQTLAARLPAHMVPERYVVLPALPATPQGKVDRRALAAPDWARPDRAAPLVGPRTPVEGRLASMWAEVLGLPAVGVTERFLDLGGHSLLAGRIAARVREELGVELAIGTLLAASTVEEMALLVTGALAAASPVAAPGLSQPGHPVGGPRAEPGERG